MVDQSSSPMLIKPISSLIVNEGASLQPLNLNDYIQSPDGGLLRFSAALTNGASLPKGLIGTTDGIISGIPAGGTQGTYDILVTAENNIGIELTVAFSLVIKPNLAMAGAEHEELFGTFKTKVWEALINNLPVPDVGDILNRPISVIELYYLLQRFAVLTIWDVYNLEMPSEKRILQLEGMSQHFTIYDRGSCIVGAPKDLFNYERTLEDALITARVMAREVYHRSWTIELSGFNKMVRGAWVELQHLGDKNGRHIDILRYDPTTDDMRIYTEQAKAFAASSGMGM
jgi:hypothetical protein